MALTNRANRKNFAVGFAPQTAKGSVAASGSARIFQMQNVTTDRGRQFIHPQGSTGSQFNKDTFRHVYSAPIVRGQVLGSRQFIGTLLEMISFGKPTVSNAQLTEANDTNSVLSAWSLTGVRPGYNTEYAAGGAAKLYVKIETNVIKLYKDSAFANLVAQGNAVNGAVTLAEQNNSGLTGSVTSTSATPADDTDITLTIDTVEIAWAATPQRYWTVFVDDGKKLRTYKDCVMKRFAASSETTAPLLLDIEIWAMDESIGATALASNVPASNPYAHAGDLVVRNALDTAPVTQDPISVEFEFDRDLMAIAGTANKPQDIYSKIIASKLRCKFEPTDELDTLLGLVDTWDSIDCKYTVSSKLLAVTFDKLTLVNPNYPGFSGEDAESVDVEWVIVEETAATPATPVTITYQP